MTVEYVSVTGGPSAEDRSLLELWERDDGSCGYLESTYLKC
jgi:hypothetical protein